MKEPLFVSLEIKMSVSRKKWHKIWGFIYGIRHSLKEEEIN